MLSEAGFYFDLFHLKIALLQLFLLFGIFYTPLDYTRLSVLKLEVVTHEQTDRQTDRRTDK